MNRQSMACSAYNLQINCEVAAAIDRYSGDPMKSDLDERVREGEAKGLFGYIAQQGCCTVVGLVKMDTPGIKSPHTYLTSIPPAFCC